jgi:hypothetical protein
MRLPGTSCKEEVATLFVHSWSYVTNWVYVMLSRVKTLDGFFLRMPLSTNLRKYHMSQKLIDMLDNFRSNHSPAEWGEEDYEEMFGDLAV